MGRFSLSFFKKILIAFFVIPLSFAQADATIEGVGIPTSFKCAEKEVPLSGSGLRTATFFKIKIYVLSLYAAVKIKNGAPEELDQRPICFVMTYLKDFNEKDVDRAWDYQFKESGEYSYPELKKNIQELKGFFGGISGSRRQTIELSADSTKFYENDTLRGEIKGSEFQKTFLSIWFGKNPPTQDLKDSLLKGK
jgi:hypothetical protein